LGTVSGNAQKDPRNESGIIVYQRPSDVLSPCIPIQRATLPRQIPFPLKWISLRAFR
jgi:hypothetical protein